MIDWEKYGFKLLYQFDLYHELDTYQREGFPFVLVPKDGFLKVMYYDKGTLYIFSKGLIPATNQSVVLLLKAFNVPKNP